MNQVDPLLVRVLLKHTRGTQRGPIRLDRHLKHLIAGLTAVLHQHQRIVAATPVHGGHILVRLAIPIHIALPVMPAYRSFSSNASVITVRYTSALRVSARG